MMMVAVAGCRSEKAVFLLQQNVKKKSQVGLTAGLATKLL